MQRLALRLPTAVRAVSAIRNATLCTSVDNFDQALRANRKVVVDFFGDFCAPCKKIAPFYEKLGETYTDVTFLKVDVEDQGEIAERERVHSVPFFIAYVNGKRVSDMVGAHEAKVQEFVEKINEMQ